MGIRLTTQNVNSDNERVALYDSVTDFAFGPVFRSAEDAKSFLNWTAGGEDIRNWSDRRLETAWGEWKEKFHPEW